MFKGVDSLFQGSKVRWKFSLKIQKNKPNHQKFQQHKPIKSLNNLQEKSTAVSSKGMLSDPIREGMTSPGFFRRLFSGFPK